MRWFALVGLLGLVACEGSVGPEGPMGPAGEAGVAGADGEDGLDGADGLDGLDGEQGAAGPQGPSGVVKTLYASNGNVGRIPISNTSHTPYEECFTSDYVAGDNEVALVTATMGGGVFGQRAEWDFIALVSENGGEPGGIGNGQYVVGEYLNVTVLGRVPLRRGSRYAFGGGLNSLGPSRTLSVGTCQTLVMIVRE